MFKDHSEADLTGTHILLPWPKPHTFQVNPSQTQNTIHYAHGTSDTRKVKFVVSVRDHAIVLSLSEDFVSTKDPIQVVVTNASGMEIVVPKGTYTTIPNSGVSLFRYDSHTRPHIFPG